MTFTKSIENLSTLDRRDAAELADEIIIDTITALRDRDGASRSFAEWELMLANLRARITERLTTAIDGHVHLNDVLFEIEASPDYLELLRQQEIAPDEVSGI
jgi:hypothetical protein